MKMEAANVRIYLAMQPQLMLNALTEVTKYTPQLQKDT
jgi:hypothetical protein